MTIDRGEFEEFPAHVNAALKEAAGRAATGGEKWDAQAMWQNFERRSVRGSVTPIYKYIGVPLAIAAALTIGFFAIKQIPDTPKPASQTKTYTTNPGQRANIQLADGTRIILAPVTKLQITNRTVELDGEAYFTVTSHTASPFTVRAANQNVRVLGTSFSVRKYSTDKSPLRVIVAEGRVQVANSVVGAGQGLTTTPTGNVMLPDNEVAAGLAWTDGRLVFVNAPVSDVITQIERWYNIKFTGVDSALAASRFSTTLQGDVLTDNMLGSLSTALGRRLERQGREIRVSP